MVIKPKIRNLIAMNAHPAGCKAEVQRQINYVKSQGPVNGPKKVLVIGASTGYGLASRIVSTFASGADTIGVSFEKEGSEKRTGTAGFYNTLAHDHFAQAEGKVAYSINGDAFSMEIKEETIAAIKEKLGGEVDLVVYSLASPKRTDPKDGVTYTSALKPRGEAFTARSVNPETGALSTATFEPATDKEVADTVKVMGGEDWELWIEALSKAGVLAQGCRTVAYSYIGPEVTRAIYREGCIGAAKEHLEDTGLKLNKKMAEIGGSAYVSVNKALVTRASAVIPVVSLYISLLYKEMKAKGTHEACIEQMYRLYKERLYTGGEVPVDEKGRIRIDDWELDPEIQKSISDVWDDLTEENIRDHADLEGVYQEFLYLNGFGIDSVDYEADLDPTTV
jgi:enoyl-[acyl-carrier protein] reductase/trans-2-enoyl-CoA reductase (NAD+)